MLSGTIFQIGLQCIILCNHHTNSMSKRTINEVLNCETGEPIDANEFFLKPFNEVIHYRSELQKAIRNYRDPLFTCYYCRQKIRIRGGTGFSTRKKDSFHFAHLKDSNECPIKTNNTLSKQEVDRIKYNGAKESSLHLKLKENIAECLRKNQESRGEVSNVEVELTISDRISKEWKKPDINALFLDKRIAIELQLSTTWLDVITQRQHFYSENGIYIFWVFPKFEAEDDIRKLTYSDVVYTNNENAYIFDTDCYEQSKIQRNLILKCYYKKYTREDVTIYEHWDESYITLSDLTFNPETFKIYYHDAAKEKSTLEREATALHEKNREVKRQKEKKEEKKREKEREKYKEYHLKATPITDAINSLSLSVQSLIAQEKTIQTEITEKQKDLTNLGSITEKTMRFINGYLFPPFSDNHELLDSLIKEYKSILSKNSTYESPTNEQIKAKEILLKQLNSLPVIEIGSIKYKHMDNAIHWNYIKTNYSEFQIINEAVKDSLFAEDELRRINGTHELDRLQYSKNLLFLKNFEGEIKELEAFIKEKKESIQSDKDEIAKVSLEIKAKVEKHLKWRINNVKEKLKKNQEALKLKEQDLLSKQDSLIELKKEYNKA